MVVVGSPSGLSGRGGSPHAWARWLSWARAHGLCYGERASGEYVAAEARAASADLFAAGTHLAIAETAPGRSMQQASRSTPPPQQQIAPAYEQSAYSRAQGASRLSGSQARDTPYAPPPPPPPPPPPRPQQPSHLSHPQPVPCWQEQRGELAAQPAPLRAPVPVLTPSSAQAQLDSLRAQLAPQAPPPQPAAQPAAAQAAEPTEEERRVAWAAYYEQQRLEQQRQQAWQAYYAAQQQQQTTTTMNAWSDYVNGRSK